MTKMCLIMIFIKILNVFSQEAVIKFFDNIIRLYYINI